MAVGGVRDAVLGVRLLDGSGNWLNFGGQVMKNVAGYDVSRLLAGSLGCLGVLAEVSLKVLPKPRAEATLRFEMSEGDALSRLNGWSGQALPLSAGTWQDGVLHLRLSGAEPAIAAACRKLGGEQVADATAANFWRSLRDHTASFFTAIAGQALIRISLPDTTPPLSLPPLLPTPPLIEWGGAQRWYHANPDALVEIRRLATRHQGHATRFRGQNETSCDDVFTPLAAPLMRIHVALKRSLDPARIFNRGRMYKAL
jgi:glycolate oxidase FAD binding subunit